MFLGQYNHQIDEKMRFRIPAKLKQMLGEKPFITQGTSGCLYVFKNEDAEKIVREMTARADITDKDKQKGIRLLAANGFYAEEDKQGRIILPTSLISHAKIKKNIVTTGAITHVEIWAEDIWNEYSNIDGEEFDNCLSLLSGSSTNNQ